MDLREPHMLFEFRQRDGLPVQHSHSFDLDGVQGLSYDKLS